MVNNHLSIGIIHNFTAIKSIAKDHLQLLVMPTGQTTDAMALKPFRHYPFLLKVHQWF